MKVRAQYRPGPGRLALLLDCPGGKCVVVLEGHRGRPPREVDCPKHERRKRGVREGPKRNRLGGSGGAPCPQEGGAPAPVVGEGVRDPEPTPRSAGRSPRRARRGRDPQAPAPATLVASPPATVSRPDAAPTPPSTVGACEAGGAQGWRAVREAELTQEAAAGVRKAVRALALTPRTNRRDPEERERAVEEVLRAGQAAGWLDPDGEAPSRIPGAERERERMTPEEFRALAERVVGTERAAQALQEGAE